MPKSPTATPSCAVGKLTLRRSRLTPVSSGCQVAPWSLLFIARPFWPVITTLPSARQATERNAARVPVSERTKLRPPSVVWKTRPSSPTIHPSCSDEKHAENRFCRMSLRGTAGGAAHAGALRIHPAAARTMRLRMLWITENLYPLVHSCGTELLPNGRKPFRTRRLTLMRSRREHRESHAPAPNPPGLTVPPRPVRRNRAGHLCECP